MKRKIDNFLVKWKDEEGRKPLVIYGTKQVGKTYTAISFGEEYFDNTVYIDGNNFTVLNELLKKENTIDSVISKLEEFTSEKIEKNKTLLIVDNINEPDLVNYFKPFGKFKNDYHVILIVSLRENLSKFKGEELQYKSMLPMDFEEYLMAIGKQELIDFIKNSFKNNTKNQFHSVALEYYNNFVCTGGMPEAVQKSIDTNNWIYLNSIYDKIIDVYRKESVMQDNLIDITRSFEIYESVGKQLAKPNKKFQYGFIKDGGRSKEYENSLNFLHNNGLIYKCYKLNEVKSPLSSNKDKDSFKVYYNDSGFLYKKLYINRKQFEEDDKLRMLLYENQVASTLVSNGFTLQYYQSSGIAEIDFVIQTRAGNIIPIELCLHNKSKSKALALYKEKYNPNEAIRITSDNFAIRNGVRYIPFYATFCLENII